MSEEIIILVINKWELEVVREKSDSDFFDLHISRMPFVFGKEEFIRFKRQSPNTRKFVPSNQSNSL